MWRDSGNRNSRRVLKNSKFSKIHGSTKNQNHTKGLAGCSKRPVQQGRRQREARGVRESTLRASSNENAAGGLFQHPARRQEALVPYVLK